MSSQPAMARPPRRDTLVWEATALVLFLVLTGIGFALRAGQGDLATIGPERFYSFMTLHGIGMSGVMFISGLAAVWYLLARRIGTALPAIRTVYVMVVAGVAGLIVSTAVGGFAPGWYLLYPLPLVNPTWPAWASGLAIVSLLVLGVAWLIFQLALLFGLGRKYGYRNLIGWQYFREAEPAAKIPPIALITTVSIIAGVVAIASGALFLLFNLSDWATDRTAFDPLLMKNMVFIFGHTIVNITMYLGIAIIYDVLPDYTGRPWPTNKIVVLAWNSALVFVLLAYFHHLYMDFVQPEAFQYIGQIASYLSAVPATVVTIFGAVGQVYRSGLSWSFVPLAFFLALMGWVIGGFAAVVDSTIAVNIAFHNTLWVPAHFHTYFLMGYVLILFGFVYRLAGAAADRLARSALWIMVAGGYGFLAMFYLAGALGVPRRYATYEAIPLETVESAGRLTAEAGTLFSALFVVGFVLYLASLFVRRGAAPAAAE